MHLSRSAVAAIAALALLLAACRDAGGVRAERSDGATNDTVAERQTTSSAAQPPVREDQATVTTSVPNEDVTRTTASRPRPSSENGETITEDIQLFWARSATDFQLDTFEALPQDRIVAVYDADGTGVFCDGEEVLGDEVFDNAFASFCDEGYLIAYDQPGLMELLTDQIGPTAPAIVFAHEWGHIAQFQAGVFLSPVISEQQADCLAGSWAADAFDRSYPPMDSLSSLDEAVQAALANADAPGQSSFDPDAHGNGFDRVRAFQEGFERGVSFCADYAVTPPPLFQVPFEPGLEFQTGGNLPMVELLDATAFDLAAYFAEQSGTDPALVPEDVYTQSQMANLYRQLGDNGLLTALAMRWGLSAPLESEALLVRACLVGGWMQLHLAPVDENVVSLSPGDLDEAIAALVQLSAADRNLGEPGLLFETVAAMRLGVLQGASSCGGGS
ncbi:MAG: hypothetical protein ACC652_06350 [Acidimicrobiales bacterium]